MGYYIDLGKISIDAYKEKLTTAYLPPSRLILKENLDERFNIFKNEGISNAKELMQTLKKKEKLEELSKMHSLSADYLKILLRELKSMLPKPNKIRDFHGISPNTIAKLDKLGIKTTLKLFDGVVDANCRTRLAAEAGINDTDIMELTKLTDLSRIKWVGTTFARVLYELGVDTVEIASKSDPVHLHQRINQHNKERSIYKGHIGLNDIKILVDAAKEVPLDIEY